MFSWSVVYKSIFALFAAGTAANFQMTFTLKLPIEMLGW